ncbi:uncharacterized protein (TIGR03435 family) [Granulicella aggregans]|uniref:Uncharacterized protein (TIGR03435 family) n=1 Tax=Granulicella aggregans TaxID=474949 RepID=A0A7W7ZD55_9BACT|nr:TIGR03435 family protein [Granulicella aggregans]MBB5057389.1 uncharacterized protein (TIGR03435 family) [Granulicella aggregans]
MLGLLWVVGLGYACAQATSAKTNADLAFEAATIKPAAPSPDGHTHINYPEGGRFSAINITLINLTGWAYDMPQKQILDGPSWMNSTRFDFQATTDSAADVMLRAMTSEQDRMVKRRMVQRLLEDRFSMKLHRETRVLPAYDLVVAKSGSKLTASQSNGKSYGGGRTYFHAEGLSMDLIAEQLSQITGRIVVDKTGLDGRYDFKLKWTPDDAPASEDSSPELFTAIEEQLGLQLKPAKEPVAVLVVDHVESSSPN